MSWNHRVMSEKHESGEVTFTIREVFCNKDGRVEGWTAEPIAPQGETVEELRSELEMMLACLDRDVLDEAEQLARSETSSGSVASDDFDGPATSA